MPLPWLASALSHVAYLADSVEPFALMGVYQSRKYHKEALEQDRELHGKEVKVAQDLTEKEMDQAAALHEEQLLQSKDFFRAEYHLANEIMHRDHTLQHSLHEASMWASRLFHADSKKYTLKLFEKELEHAQAVSRRESMRDHLVQESQRAQTIMIVNTLLVACVFGLLIEGNLPENSPQAAVTWYSITMGVSMNMLILSVWFSMNLQSRIAKYRIHGRNVVKYGKEGRVFSSFREYYKRYCKPIYRLTHCCLWVGMTSLIIAGAILLAAKFELHHGNGTASAFYIISQGVLVFLLAAVSQMFGSVGQEVKDYDDFADFEDFLSKTKAENAAHDRVCNLCHLPPTLYKFCSATGRPHHTSPPCPDCQMDPTATKHCPATGRRHVLLPQQAPPPPPPPRDASTSQPATQPGFGGAPPPAAAPHPPAPHPLLPAEEDPPTRRRWQMNLTPLDASVVNAPPEGQGVLPEDDPSSRGYRARMTRRGSASGLPMPSPAEQPLGTDPPQAQQRAFAIAMGRMTPRSSPLVTSGGAAAWEGLPTARHAYVSPAREDAHRAFAIAVGDTPPHSPIGSPRSLETPSPAEV
eukprot:TRINITY_DN1109_c2_g1_i1.p1 TRINITY_DN1109_c2_g1~~TRINITY_DN1109_c2_g1_i1.p1  ORF type:complete len:581 (+),score=206.82 TRINITY_DN1109_c2_g1_i1:83-1825(+)